MISLSPEESNQRHRESEDKPVNEGVKADEFLALPTAQASDERHRHAGGRRHCCQAEKLQPLDVYQMSWKNEQADPACSRLQDDIPNSSKEWVGRLSLQSLPHASNSQFKKGVCQDFCKSISPTN